MLLEALALLRDRGTELTALVVGRGPLAAELHAASRRLGLDDVVEFRDDVETQRRGVRADEGRPRVRLAVDPRGVRRRRAGGARLRRAGRDHEPPREPVAPARRGRRRRPAVRAGPGRRWRPPSCAPRPTTTAPPTPGCAATTGTPSPTGRWRRTRDDRDRPRTPRHRGAGRRPAAARPPHRRAARLVAFWTLAVLAATVAAATREPLAAVAGVALGAAAGAAPRPARARRPGAERRRPGHPARGRSVGGDGSRHAGAAGRPGPARARGGLACRATGSRLPALPAGGEHRGASRRRRWSPTSPARRSASRSPSPATRCCCR